MHAWNWAARTTTTATMEASSMISSRPASPHLHSTSGKRIFAISTAPLADSYKSRPNCPNINDWLISFLSSLYGISDVFVPECGSRWTWEWQDGRFRTILECIRIWQRCRLQESLSLATPLQLINFDYRRIYWTWTSSCIFNTTYYVIRFYLYILLHCWSCKNHRLTFNYLLVDSILILPTYVVGEVEIAATGCLGIIFCVYTFLTIIFAHTV